MLSVLFEDVGTSRHSIMQINQVHSESERSASGCETCLRLTIGLCTALLRLCKVRGVSMILCYDCQTIVVWSKSFLTAVLPYDNAYSD